MKNTVITVRRKKIEIVTLTVCFILANIINLCSIIAYKTSFAELFTSIGYVLVATFGLYIIWCTIRLAIHGINNLTAKNKE